MLTNYRSYPHPSSVLRIRGVKMSQTTAIPLGDSDVESDEEYQEEESEEDKMMESLTSAIKNG